MRLILLLTLLLALDSCGRKTPPVPYNSGSSLALKPFKQVQIHYRGNKLRLVAYWPEKVLPGPITVEAYLSAASCPVCEQEPDYILLLKEKNPPVIQTELAELHSLEPTFVQLEPFVEIIFPVESLDRAVTQGRLHFRLAPLDQNLKPASFSPLFTLQKPQALAPPKIRLSRPSAESLLLKWEGATDLGYGIFQSSGLGINLYIEESGYERLLAGPLFSGEYHLNRPKGRLLARRVDSWGNESDAVTLYEPE